MPNRYMIGNIADETDRTASGVINLCHENDIQVHRHIVYPEYSSNYLQGDNERSARNAWLSLTGVRKISRLLFPVGSYPGQRQAFLEDMENQKIMPIKYTKV